MNPHAAVTASTFLGDVALVLVGAAAIGVLFRRLGQPAVLGYLLAGFVVGPYVPIPLFADHQRIEALAEFGVVLVMLSVGLEFSIRRLGEVLPRVGVPALIQMSTLAWLGFLIGRTLGWGGLESVFLGACLAVSSTMVVAQVFKEVPVDGSVRELAFGILVAQDLVAILAIAALTAAASATGGATHSSVVTSTAGELLLFLLVLLVVGLLLVPRSIRYLVRVGSREMLVVAVAGLGFGLALVARQMGYSVALGAFVAGALIAESGEGHRIGALMAPIRDLFAAVFFVAVGMTIDPRAIGGVLAIGLVVVVAIVLGQLVSVGIGGTLAGRGVSTALTAGASLGQIGEFSFIIAAVGVGAGTVRSDLATIVVLAALITAFTTPLLVRGAGSLALALDRRLPHRVRRLLTLYPSWLDELSERRRGGERPGWRRLLVALGIDVLALIGLTLLTARAHRRFAETVSRETGLAPEWAVGAVLLAAVLLALPFAVGLVRSARRLGRVLAESALPRRRQGVDMAQAPRRAMSRLLEVAVALIAVSLFVTATQPVLPPGWGIGVLAVAALAVVRVFWRTSDALDGHVRAGAQAFAEALLRPTADEDFEEVEELLPGLGDLTGLLVPARSSAAGRTLADLDLRGRTGATVLAVCRAGEIHELPGADWRIEVGDRMGLTGSHEAVASARRLLLGESDRSRDDPTGEPAAGEGNGRGERI